MPPAPRHRLEFRLILVILACLLLPTLTVGWLGYREAYDNIRAEKIRSVGHVASARREELLGLLKRADSRAEAVLGEILAGCRDGEGRLDSRCAAAAIATFVHNERAVGGKLSRLGPAVADIVVGTPSATAGRELPAPGQLARFSSQQEGSERTFDVFAGEEGQGPLLTVTFPAATVQSIFTTPEELGHSGETFLADAQGLFITKPRYPSFQGHAGHPISAVPMQTCLAQHDSETLDEDYRSVAIIHGFRYLPEIGGGCIMAHFDQAEAFAPLEALKERILVLTGAFVMAAATVAVMVGRGIARPAIELTAATREIMAGNYEVRARAASRDEIGELARSFNRMAERLHMTLGELREQKGELEERVRARTAELEAANQKLAALSVSDGLTGLANRRHLDAVLEEEWRRAERKGQPLAVAMMDVDHFKKYNDLYGHLAGDECLRRVGAALTAGTQRAGELAARYGGEEFAAVLPGINIRQAASWAEEMRARLAGLALPHSASVTGTVTVSVGVAAMVPREGLSVADLIAAADGALYLAKERGRDRVAAAE